MLSTRSRQTDSGQKPLRVHTFRPRSRVGALWVRNVTIGVTLLGVGLGACHALSSDLSGADKVRVVLAETLAGGAIGLVAGLGGSLLYAGIGGRPGAALGLAGAAILGAGGWRGVLPHAGNVPSAITTGAQNALGYIPTSPILYAPVFFDSSIKEETLPEAPVWNGPWNDRVLFLGMNPASVRTAVAQMSRQASVSPYTDSGLPDHVKVNGKWMELGSSYGIAAFVKTLGLPDKNAAGVRRALTICETGARDELGQLAQVWARGEKGAFIPSRMVLAGHSNGDGVWGDDNGSLRLGPLLQLSRALPHASCQIEDAFVTGCYSGGEVTMDQYLLIFPRAKTIWAYDAQAPGVDNGATVDQAGWEVATRGRRSNYVPSKSASAGRYLAIWSATTGYHAQKPPLNLAQLKGKVQWMDEHFASPAMSGEEFAFDGGYKIPIRITDPHTGLVREYYSWLVRLTQNKGLPEDERAVWTDKKQQIIRLLYWNATVAPRFAQKYHAQIQSGYREVGLPAPDFALLGRAQTVKAVDQYIARLDKKPNASAQAQNLASLLSRGVKDLDPSVIPDGWV
jgi:hypothetical protein